MRLHSPLLVLLISQVSFVVHAVAGATRDSDHSDLVSTIINKTFDYVIIGGGTAGLVVAARLSEDPHISVAVIEAGIHHVGEPLVDTPELFGRAVGNPAFDWGFVTTPQSALDGAVVRASRGKMLGGSSGLNFMAWNRASTKEYDAWQELGATGWTWDALLPYFKKSESVLPPPAVTFPGDQKPTGSAFNASHGRNGPIQVSYNVLYSNLTSPYVETMGALGVSVNSNPYGGNATGLSNSACSVDRINDIGRRSYSASTYYNISKDRPNLTVFLSTQATRINLANSSSSSTRSLQAVSVAVVAVNSSGVTGILSAHKDIILSAGAIQTPQLLELSGIGNQTLLRSVGIETLIDLPGVGENLQDQPFIAQDFELSGDFSTFDELRNNATFLAEQEAEYAANHTGVFAEVVSVRTFAPFNTVVSAATLAHIQQSARQTLSSGSVSPLQKAQYDIQLRWLADDNVADFELLLYPGGGQTKIAPAPNTSYVTLNTAVLHPLSRGSVHINTSEPLAPPVIDPNYLGADADFRSMFEVVKFARRVAETEPLAQGIAGPHDPPANMASDADLIKYLKANLGPFYHHVGTAAMLPRELGGVVDPVSLRVYGTENLRVVDSSLIPLQFAAHTQATVYAISERASDIFRNTA
ncbi:alcohol oxidase [Trametes meyenii]|nr:alcohol oxidase [Trametes meyenii]